ncbi:hypothetical protein WKW79_34745 [Variovorax robiniae]|uniref:DUF4410 domain-containing protein n=1 Tax=Variovorax robiniae TaxID=1836199 RepID=A0ABU8XIQ5_9BURK
MRVVFVAFTSARVPACLDASAETVFDSPLNSTNPSTNAGSATGVVVEHSKTPTTNPLLFLRLHMSGGPSTMNPAARFRSLTLSACVLLSLAGCASAPQREAQWTDPALGGQSRFLRGEKVLIACDAFDVAVRRTCEDQLFREVQAKGATPVQVPANTVLLNDRELDGQLVASARSLGAKAVFTMTLTPATSSAGSGVSLGLGGFSFGGSGGAGVGLSVPVGGGGWATGFAANGRVTDASSSRLLWTATLVAAPSRDLNAQFADLSRAMLDAAQGAGLF